MAASDSLTPQFPHNREGLSVSTATGRILSGMRPTGRLHLGNYVGALENWVRLQDAGWTNFHMVADWHMLTTGFEDTSRLQEHTWEMVLDWSR